MSEITRKEYYAEVREIAETAVSECMGADDTEVSSRDRGRIEEYARDTVDGHQWVIYYAYNNDILRHSDNADAYEMNFGADDMAEVIKDSGFDGLKTVMAYFAMECDGMAEIDSAIEEWQDARESAQESAA